MKKPLSGLYAISPELTDSVALTAKVEAALRGGAQAVQYRAKSLPDYLRYSQASEIAKVCASRNALFIVNDSVELARQTNADGVHLGKHDMDVTTAREALGHGKIIGVSCYDDLARARNAVSQGADYIAFGSFFPSTTKPGASRVSRETLQKASAEFKLPLVAIGGINEDNARSLISAGANAIAVLGALFNADDIEQQARRYTRLFLTPAMQENKNEIQKPTSI
jgi:thiamine-phosphate pyrophosphorylase